MFHTQVAEKIKTLIICSIKYFYIEKFMRYVEKYGTAGQAIDYNMAHAHCMLGT